MLNDLKTVIGFTTTNYYIKERNEYNRLIIKSYSHADFFNILSNWHPFYDDKTTGKQIVTYYINEFRYEKIEFIPNTKDDRLNNNIINLFHGFKYDNEELNYNDFTPLQPLLNHIKLYICNNDENKYNYLMCWFANIIQNVTVKNGTMPILCSTEEGCGKSFIVKLFCELLAEYAIPNISDMSKVFGRFNDLIVGKLLIVLNESPEADQKFGYVDKIKTALTEEYQDIEAKGCKSYIVKDYSNYIMITNNYNPVIVNKGQRRFIFFNCSNAKNGDLSYFDQLFKPYQPVKNGPYNPDMMKLLYYYMKTQININNWDAE